jgi:hypothetical protein
VPFQLDIPGIIVITFVNLSVVVSTMSNPSGMLLGRAIIKSMEIVWNRQGGVIIGSMIPKGQC